MEQTAASIEERCQETHIIVSFQQPAILRLSSINIHANKGLLIPLFSAAVDVGDQGRFLCTREYFMFERLPQLYELMNPTFLQAGLRAYVCVCVLCPCVFSCICSGTIGSQNMDNIDNMEEDFHPLTLKRSIVPQYTPTAW